MSDSAGSTRITTHEPERLRVHRPNRRNLERSVGRGATRLLLDAGRLAARRGWRAYLVGGVVRDLMLGRSTTDLDLVIEGDARRLARELARLHGAEFRAFRPFGTAAVFVPGRYHIDLAAARRERYARPAALPRVEPADLQQDLLRRDFTINSMALRLESGRFGELIDPLGGRTDLRNRTIRVLHARSFVDDPTRALRAIRFATRLGFGIENETARLMRRAVRDGLFALLSSARLRAELRLLFEERKWGETARALRAHRLWSAVDRRLRPSDADLRLLHRLEALVERYGEGLLAAPARHWVFALGALTRSWDAAAHQRIVQRLKPDRRARSELLAAGADSGEILAALRRARPRRPSRVRRACHGRSATGQLLALALTRSASLRAALHAWLSEWRFVRADIDGRDLLAAGLRQGPGLARGLEAALEAKLDGRAPGARQQLEIALEA